ncbi:MAG: glycoside hydrolase family 9 protein, partial [Lachnospiraceae bacterium]|nr:glycoside hydrolase family 9 protein [Lachnospiraceae bacterium]
YLGVTVYEQGAGRGTVSYVEPADLQAARAFAMVLAKFSYLYQFYDTEYATQCLKAADRAWRYAQLNEGEEKIDEWKFAAAAELYRAAGKQECHRYISEYLSEEDYGEKIDEVLFLGGVTYISTTQPVKLTLCEDIITLLMSKAEEISEAARDSLFLTGGNEEQDNMKELLLDMMYMTLVNHVISNHEYENIIENHLHYFMGRNKKAISYIDNVGENNYRLVDENMGIMKQFEADSRFIFMLSEVVSAYET